MLTAEGFLLKDDNYIDIATDYPKLHKAIQESMIEFAKLHCEAQLKAILENVKVKTIVTSGGLRIKKTIIDKDSIIKAYNLNDIK